MKRIRRWFPLVIAALFMIVTVGHEANFIGSFEPAGWAWLGLPFSLGVDLATFVSLYFTRWATTRTWAWRSYVVFVSASGVFNLAYLFGVAAESGRFGRGLVADAVLGIGVATVALFPPVAISVMGFVEREAEGLRKPKSKPMTDHAQSLRAGLMVSGDERTSERLQAFSGNGKRSFSEFAQAMNSGELDVTAMTGDQVGEWAGMSAATGRRWKRRAINDLQKNEIVV